MPAKAQPGSNENLGLERIVFFSDAVMAIAITLLALDLRLPDVPGGLRPEQIPAQLAALGPRFLTFFISFIVVAIYWISHHRYFSYLRRYDTPLILLNFCFLFFIICMPFLASLLGEYVTAPITLIAYTLAIAALGLSMALIWWYASRDHRLIASDVDPALIRRINVRLFSSPVMFLLAVPFAYISSVAVIVVWWTSPLMVLLAMRIWGGKVAGRGGRLRR